MSSELIAALVEAFSNFTKSHESSYDERNLCRILDELSVRLAKDKGFRHDLPHALPSFWLDMLLVWQQLRPDWEDQSPTRNLVLSLSRFTRNLVANAPDNQNQAFPIEGEIRRMLYQLSSFTQLENKTLHPIRRILVQTLSNLVTLNDDLAGRLWDSYTTLPEDKDIITRLLASLDTSTIDATMVLILNSINAKGEARQRLASANSLRIIIQILDHTEKWVAQESGEGEEGFTIAYRLFETFLEQDLAYSLFQALAIEDEPITPHQISFLKFMDSYLRHTTPSDLCSYSQRAIQQALGIRTRQSDSSVEVDVANFVGDGANAHLNELDLRLPQVFAAMILMAQCLITIHLNSQAVNEAGMITSEPGYVAVVDASLAPGFVESVVETLRLVDRLLPPIVFGEAVARPGQGEISLGDSMESGSFNYLKRDLVRLLGIISHERRDIQDRIRECDGILVVMNLCVIDERNPYLQEHALFALRNILHQNPNNQAVVGEYEKLTKQ